MALTGRSGLVVTGCDGETLAAADYNQPVLAAAAHRRVSAGLLGGPGRYAGGARSLGELAAAGTQYPAVTLIVADDSGEAWWFETTTAGPITFLAAVGAGRLYAVVRTQEGVTPAAVGSGGDVQFVAQLATAAAPAHSLLLGAGTLTAGAFTAFTGAAAVAWPPAGGGGAGRPTGFQFTLDGGGAPLAAGELAAIRIDDDLTLTEVALVADVPGELTLDLLADTYAALPATTAASICGAAVPALTGGRKYRDAALAGWSPDCDGGTFLRPVLGGIPEPQAVHLDVSLAQSFTLAAAPDFNLGTAGTVMGWLWIDAYGDASTSQNLIWAAAYPTGGWALRLGDGTASDRLQFLWCNGGTPHGAEAPGGLGPHVWAHVAAVYQAGTATLYVNGSPIGSGYGAATIANATATITVGNGTNSTVRLDEWAVYADAKDSAFITAQVNAGAGRRGLASDPNLIAGWHFEHDATDYSGHGHDLTPVGAPTYVAGPVAGGGTITRLSVYLSAVRR